MSKIRVAVFFGGRSPEHDVSVVSGLQVLGAVDPNKYDAFPVYVAQDGRFLTGDVLRERSNYMLSGASEAHCVEVTPDVKADKIGRLIPKKTGFFGKPKAIEFDVALPVFHGLYGEDGHVQGLFEMMGVPYTGSRVMASSILMDKVATKWILHDLDIPHLPYAVIERPDSGYFISQDDLKKTLGKLKFPLILKPVHLGSSIGVAKVNDLEELSACLPAVFEYDDSAIVEPFVQNLVEYNVAVSKIGGTVRTSAIERPKATEELLDFKQKYLSGGDNKSGNKLGGSKSAGQISEGMLSLTRELNPELKPKQEEQIRAWAETMFSALNGSGAPRIDYICDGKSGEIWMNEVNPIPGSYGYFLWEAASDPLLFSELVSGLI
ncbi:MAG: D-alanine--D-alanine ligase, partial [Pseudomonadota bacterium]